MEFFITLIAIILGITALLAVVSVVLWAIALPAWIIHTLFVSDEDDTTA